MYTILENNSEYIIKNSRFISFSYYVEKEEEVKNIINELKDKYKDSTHIVYAYRLIDKEYKSDDNEPSGTAGSPILNIINKENLYNTLIVVIRYFGGIKLGSGGLIRAYSKSAKDVINKVKLTKGYEIEFETTYEDINNIKSKYKDNIIDIIYEDKVIVKLRVNKELLDTLNIYKYNIINKDIYLKEKL